MTSDPVPAAGSGALQSDPRKCTVMKQMPERHVATDHRVSSTITILPLKYVAIGEQVAATVPDLPRRHVLRMGREVRAGVCSRCYAITLANWQPEGPPFSFPFRGIFGGEG